MEFRFEVDWKEKITVKLVDGKAEIFGSELCQGVEYGFYGGSKLAVFTYHGCILEVAGQCAVEYTAKETPMSSTLNLHLALESLREEAGRDATKKQNGPRILIVGPSDCGKTTLSRTLMNYAIRNERRPVLVDLDPNDGTLIMPTTIGAIVADRMDIEQRNGIDLTTSPPLLYSYGHHTPATNLSMFKRITEKLASLVKQKIDGDGNVRISGVIIDTSAWIDSNDVSHELLIHQMEQFEVDCVVVLGLERLSSEISSKLRERKSPVSVVSIPKSGGVVTRDKTFRRQMQIQRIREYFYGTPNNELSPYTSSVPFTEVAVRRIGETDQAPLSTLPIGSDRKYDEADLVKIDVGPVLLHTVLAVSNSDLKYNATEKDEQTLPEVNIAGFVYVSEVEEKKKRLYMLCPNPGKLPKRYLWLSSLRWAEM